MRSFLFVIAACSFLTISAQTKKTVEIAATFNSVDPIIPLGNITFADSRSSTTGDNNNKSYAAGITAKYFIADNFALRLRTIYTDRNLNLRDVSFLGSNSLVLISNTQSLFKMAPGIQWSFVQKRICFFGGLDLPVTIIGKMTEQTYLQQPYLGGINTLNGNYELPGGTSIGIGMFTGTNYALSKKIAIGFEIGSAYEKTSIGGTLVRSQVTAGQSAGQSTSTTDETVKQLKFSGLQAGFSLTFSFR
jgi:hypothetical protein